MSNILLVYDVDGWCWCHQAQDLKRFAPDRLSVTAVPSARMPRDACDRFDAILQFSWPESSKLQGCRQGVLLAHEGCMHSVHDPSWQAQASTSKLRNRENAQKILPRADFLLGVNKRLSAFGEQFCGESWYVPAGVNTDVFAPSDELRGSGKLRVGWCGQSPTPGSQNTKGRQILDAVMEKAGGFCDFLINDRTHQNALSREEMCDWYNAIDVFLCTSITEGTPVPPLEAMACGRPVISTSVGDMPELVAEDVNGWLVGTYKDEATAKRTVTQICQRLETLSKSRTQLINAGHQARGLAVQNRCWRVIAPQWFSRILGYPG